MFKLSSLSDKETRNIEILELLRTKGPVSRTEISKITGINIVSISNYVNHFLDKKLVIEKGFDVSSGGRKPELLELNVKENHVMGLDLGQEEIRASLTNLGMNVVEKIIGPISKQSPSDLETKSLSLIDGLIKKSKIAVGSIRAIGVAITDGDFGFIEKEVKGRFGIEAFFGNRVSCAAFGEKRLNPDANVAELLYIYSSLGQGIVIKGNTCQTGDESSKESNYLRPWPNALGMAETARGVVLRGVGTEIVKIAKDGAENITEQVVIKAALSGDEIASNIVRNVGINLGLRTAYLVNLFDPDAVVIGGGVEKAGELILGAIKRMVEILALSKYANNIKIIPGALGEDAASLGAASLAIREIFLRA